MAVQQVVWILSFATALAVHRASTDRGSARFAAGLWLGVGLAHLGWALFQLPALADAPHRVLQPGAVSVLFVPLGVLLVAPWREALAALPLALAIARIGCAPYDCCYDAWGWLLPEVAALAVLHLAARRWPARAAPIVLCGFGAIRLLSTPLRSAPAADPFLDPAWIAVAWIAAGCVVRVGRARDARVWPGARGRRLLRELALVLVVWLLFPLAALAFGAGSGALLIGSLCALGLVLAVREARLPRPTPEGMVVLVGAALFGCVISAQLSPPAAGVEWLAVFGLVAIVPVVEELLFRERLLGVLRSLWGAPAALLVSSALFALGHADPRAMPAAFAGGLVCGGVMLRTGSLAGAVGLHAGWNLGVLT